MMRARSITVAVALIGAVSAAAPAGAQSQSDEWEVQIAPLYLWAVDMGGTMTVREQALPVDIAVSDAFDKLEAAFTVHFEAWKGDWGLLADVNWLDIGGEQTLPGPLGGSVKVDLQQYLIELAGGYEFDDASFVIVGVRYAALDPKVTLPMGNVVDQDQSWLDAFVGLMWRPQLSQRWTFSGRFDIGGGSSDLVWNLSGMFDVAFSRHVALIFGYRYLDYDYNDEDQGFGYDVSQQGPLAALRFFW